MLLHAIALLGQSAPTATLELDLDIRVYRCELHCLFFVPHPQTLRISDRNEFLTGRSSSVRILRAPVASPEP